MADKERVMITAKGGEVFLVLLHGPALRQTAGTEGWLVVQRAV